MYRQYIADFKTYEQKMGCGNSQQTVQKSEDSTKQYATETPTQGIPPPGPPPPPQLRSPQPGTQGRDQIQANGTQPPKPTAAARKPLSEEEKRKIEEQKRQIEELLKKANEAMALLEKASGLGKTDTGISKEAILGNIEMTCPSPAKIVRIFTSSTFTDTKQERNILMEHAYPKIKEHCRKLGYEFQVVDMRWGVRDEATDDHMGTELCLKELKLCQKLSTGPNFVSLLSHKYGYTAFPRVIEATEFEKIYENVIDKETKELFHKWYTRDDNAVPSAYVLSSISTHLPDFLSREKDKQKVAKNQWWEESGKMQDALEETAKKVFDVSTARKFIMSVTEAEVEEGLLKVEDPSKNSLWLKRNIADIEKQESSYELSRFMECLGSEEKVKKARSMLKELKEDKMQRKLDPSKVLNYSVHWNPEGGINPANDKHKKYLETLCSDFITNMTSMIDQSIAQKEKVDDPLVDECIQHVRFCQGKLEGFAGRSDTLQMFQPTDTVDNYNMKLTVLQ